MKPRAILIRAPGTNCDFEAAKALELAGARVESAHVRAVLSGRPSLSQYDILVIPGGFSYGDDVAAGKIFANELAGFEPLHRFVESGKPVLGICNGFQVLVKAGFLPDGGRQTVSLAHNDSGRFECRWVRLKVPKSRCLFTEGLPSEIELPIAHGEGKFVAESEKELDRLEAGGRFALQYAGNPNGSERDVAGLVNEKGNCLGLMPHPERFASPYLHPTWTKTLPPPEALGLRFFENAVRYVK